ncbi:MAG: LD-carboxypeptidase [Actinomycetota bacterium]|nr:LD-carboxypeptidase [Actinomycetota bacterium]
MPDVLAPPPPQPGSAVAIVCPSFPAVAEFPHRVERGSAFLESLGFKVKLMPNASLSTGWTAGSGEQRAADIHSAFADPEVSVVLAAIGGNHSAQLLQHLDYNLIASNPKVFQGYSDVSTLHWAMFKNSHLQTFHGPALASELAEFPNVLSYTENWMKEAWNGGPMVFEPADEWTDEFLDWEQKKDLERPRDRKPSDGWQCVREGTAEGFLIGGCLETIMWHIRDTDIWTQPEGAILFVETSEEAPSPGHVDAYMTTLDRGGVFDAVTGLIVGRPAAYDDERKTAMLEVVARRTERAGIPVLADVDIGHTDPMLTLRMGAQARLDAGARSFQVL